MVIISNWFEMALIRVTTRSTATLADPSVTDDRRVNDGGLSGLLVTPGTTSSQDNLL